MSARTTKIQPIASLVHGAKLFYRDDRCSIGTWNEVIVSAWSAFPNAARIGAIRRAQEHILSFDDPIGGVVVVRGLADFQLPDESVRREATAAYEVGRERRAPTAVSIEADGFAAAAARAFLSGVSLLSATNNPQKIFDARGPAISWLVSRLTTPARPRDERTIREVVDDVVSQIGVGP